MSFKQTVEDFTWIRNRRNLIGSISASESILQVELLPLPRHPTIKHKLLLHQLNDQDTSPDLLK